MGVESSAGNAGERTRRQKERRGTGADGTRDDQVVDAGGATDPVDASFADRHALVAQPGRHVVALNAGRADSIAGAPGAPGRTVVAGRSGTGHHVLVSIALALVNDPARHGEGRPAGSAVYLIDPQVVE